MTKPQSRLTAGQKAAICAYYKKNSKIHLEEIGKWAQREFKLQTAPDRSTIGRIIKNSSRFESLKPHNARLLKASVISFEPLEEAMTTWVLQMEHQKRCLSDALIQKQALRLAKMMNIPEDKFKASKGWLHRFKKRHGFKQFRIHGESGDAQMTGIEEQMQLLQARIAAYNHDNIYNMDETGLFYNLAPDTTIASRQIEGIVIFMHQFLILLGVKKEKTRITIAFTVNATGTDRWEPLYIGHAAKPRCFKGKTGSEYGFFYLHNKKAWMTGFFFEIYLHRFNSYIERTKMQKVLLIIDNAPSHIYNHLNLEFVEVHPLSPNTTSKLQPLDAGIISSFKRHYRQLQLENALDTIELSLPPYKVDQLCAMRWVLRAWTSIDFTVFVNCWRHTTILNTDISVAQIAANDLANLEAYEVNELTTLFNALPLQNPMSITNFLNPIEEEATDQFFTDEELVGIAQENLEETTEQEASENSLSTVSLTQVFSKPEQIKFLTIVTAILEERRSEQTFSLLDLKKIRSALREELRRAGSKAGTTFNYSVF